MVCPSFPCGSVVPANARDASSVPELGRSPGEGNGNPLQYSCLGNPMEIGVWWAMVHGLQKVRHDLKPKQQQQAIGQYFMRLMLGH